MPFCEALALYEFIKNGLLHTEAVIAILSVQLFLAILIVIEGVYQVQPRACQADDLRFLQIVRRCARRRIAAIVVHV